MTGLSEIRKLNNQSKADLENSRKARYTVLRDGSILLSCNGRAKTLERGRDNKEITDFLNAVRGASTGKIRVEIEKLFSPVAA